MIRKILLAIPVCFLAACSSTPEKVETIVVNEAPPRPSLKMVRREPGSLWSEDSRWNDIYSVGPSRVLGDTVRIKLSTDIKERISRLVDPQKGLGAEKAAEGTAKMVVQEVLSPVREESNFMEAAVTEVLPRGFFAVRALQTIRVGTQETRVELFGNVREKDIDQADTVTSENVINLNLNASVGGRPFQPIPLLDKRPAATTLATNVAAAAVATGEKK